jgi:predicted metal-binding protein
MDREKLETWLARFPIFEYTQIRREDLSFLEQVRYICRTECPQYGKSWSCPPAVGSVEECRARCSAFSEGFLFSTIAEVDDIENMEASLATRMEHENITRQIRDFFRESYKEVLTLSTESCAICKKCTYPEGACRHPDRMFPCIESYGILVTDLAEKYGMSFMNGSNVITWFSLILYR